MKNTTQNYIDQVKLKVQELNAALLQLETVLDTSTIGLSEWAEHNEDCLYELESEINDEDGEDDEV